MIGGDISNEVPRRILVTWDYLTDVSEEPKKVLGLVVGTHQVRRLNSGRVSALHRLVDTAGVRLELVVFGTDDDGADSYLQNLDNRMWHPFNYARGYDDAYQLVSDLPYRPEVMGVIDQESRASAYGSYAMHTDYFARAI